MANNGKIEIVIKGGQGDKGGKAKVKPKESAFKEDFGIFDSVLVHQTLNLASEEMNNIINGTSKNIGNFSGDYFAQTGVVNTLTALNMAKSISAKTLAGARYGGAAGAVLGFSFAMIGNITRIGINELANEMKFKKQNYDISQLRKISGLDGLTNGGRI